MMRPDTPYLRVAALSAAFVLAPVVSAMAAPGRTMVCPFLKEGRLTFDLPATPGALPDNIDFDYPAKATKFRFANGVLVLKAVDEGSPKRVRIDLSARLDAKTGAYVGKMFTDTGGNQLMFDTSAVRCTIVSK